MRSWDRGDSGNSLAGPGGGSPEQECRGRRGANEGNCIPPKYWDNIPGIRPKSQTWFVGFLMLKCCLFSKVLLERLEMAVCTHGRDRREQGVSGSSTKEPGYSTQKNQLVHGCFSRWEWGFNEHKTDLLMTQEAHLAKETAHCCLVPALLHCQLGQRAGIWGAGAQGAGTGTGLLMSEHPLSSISTPPS